MSNEILYSFRRCPYAIRARWALLQCRKQVNLREVQLSNKPLDLTKASEKGTVPVLVLANGKVIDESIDIMTWAIKNSNMNNNFLHKGEKDNKEIEELIKENDNIFKYHLDRYKYPNRYKDVIPEYHNNALKTILRRWEEKLTSRSREQSLSWLVGSKETIADWCLWPFVRQYRLVNKEEFDLNNNLLKIKLWLDYYLNHPLYPILMKKNKFWESSKKEILFPEEITYP